MRRILIALGWPKALAKIVEDYASIISMEENGEYRLLAFGAYRVCDRLSTNISLEQLDNHYSTIIRILSTSIYNRIYVDHGDLEEAHTKRETVREAIVWLSAN
jgi:hypothetical protein